MTEEIKTTDEEGNEFIQRPIDINEKPAQKKKRGRRRVNVISLCGARLFLSEGETIDPHEEKRILESDFRLVGAKVRKVA